MRTNNLTMMGTLSKDPETYTTKHNVAVTNLIIQVPAPNDNGNYKNVYFRVTTWRDLAKEASEYQKGDKLLVIGSLNSNQYVNKQGQTRKSTEIVARTIEVVGRGKVDENSMINGLALSGTVTSAPAVNERRTGSPTEFQISASADQDRNTFNVVSENIVKQQKGEEILVLGSLTTTAYLDEYDNKRSTIEIVASHVFTLKSNPAPTAEKVPAEPAPETTAPAPQELPVDYSNSYIEEDESFEDDMEEGWI